MMGRCLLWCALVAVTVATHASATAEPSEAGVTVALAGDSTVSEYDDAPGDPDARRGWGQYLGAYLDDRRVRVRNHARGGRSSRSFISEGHWQALLDERPDYILIQFGHNDLKSKGPERHTRPDPMPDTLPATGPASDPMGWYRHNMRTYVEAARRIGAVPVIVTPMERRSFDGQRVRPMNRRWAEAAAAVAREMQTPLIDLNGYGTALLERLGEADSAFMHAVRNGRIDNTHFNEAGARIYAEQVAAQLAKQVPELRPLVSRSVRAADN